MVNGNAKKIVLREREMKKSWNIEPNETNNSLKTLSQRKQKVVLKHWTKGNKKLSWNIEPKKRNSQYF